MKLRHLFGLTLMVLGTIMGCNGYHFHVGGEQVLAAILFLVGLGIHSAEAPI